MPRCGHGGAAGQLGCPPQAMGHEAVGMSPPSHGTLGSRDIPTKTWDMGRWGHTP